MDFTSNALVPELSVKDIGKSLGFYCDIIGFEIVYQRPEEGFAYLALGEAQLMLDQSHIGRDFERPGMPADAPYGRGVNLQIKVPDIAAIVARIEKAKIDLSVALEDKWYRRGTIEVGNRQCVVADPDGYLLRPFESLGQRTYEAGRE